MYVFVRKADALFFMYDCSFFFFILLMKKVLSHCGTSDLFLHKQKLLFCIGNLNLNPQKNFTMKLQKSHSCQSGTKNGSFFVLGIKSTQMAPGLIEQLNLDTGKPLGKTGKLSVSLQQLAFGKPLCFTVEEHHLGIEQIGLCMNIVSVMMFLRASQFFRYNNMHANFLFDPFIILVKQIGNNTMLFFLCLSVCSGSFCIVPCHQEK